MANYNFLAFSGFSIIVHKFREDHKKLDPFELHARDLEHTGFLSSWVLLRAGFLEHRQRLGIRSHIGYFLQELRA